MESIQVNLNIWERRKHKKWIDDLFNSYVEFQKTLSHKKEISCAWDLKHLRPFLYFLEDNKYNKISIKSVSDYIIEQSKNHSIRTVYNRKIVLRSFLNWLFDNQKNDFSGNAIFPTIQNVDGANLKSYYSNDEIGQIINNMPRKTKEDIRNFAIVVTFACLGLRTQDLISLTKDNIDWNNNTIRFIQSKTNIETITFIPEILKYALLDYMKNSRPNIISNYVFVNQNGEQLSNHSVYNIVSEAVALVDVDNLRKHGSHIFRHSISTNMLMKNENISTIAKVIGTTTETATQDYIKYDEKILRNISLEIKLWI